MAIAAFLGLIIRNRYYWLGVVLAPAIFLLLAGLNHVLEALQGNLAPYNVGIIVPDFLIPITIGWLLVRVFHLKPPEMRNTVPPDKSTCGSCACARVTGELVRPVKGSGFARAARALDRPTRRFWDG